MGEQLEEYKFSHKEVVEALIKQQGLHHGIWMLSVQFGIGAANIQNPENAQDINPAAIIPIAAIGLQKRNELNPLAVDASAVNPKSKTPKK